jgi:hypothetical protein
VVTSACLACTWAYLQVCATRTATKSARKWIKSHAATATTTAATIHAAVAAPATLDEAPGNAEDGPPDGRRHAQGAAAAKSRVALLHLPPGEAGDGSLSGMTVNPLLRGAGPVPTLRTAHHAPAHVGVVVDPVARMLAHASAARRPLAGGVGHRVQFAPASAGVRGHMAGLLSTPGITPSSSSGDVA